MRPAEQLLGGWGRYPLEPCRVWSPGSIAEQRDIVTSGDELNCIARGLGRSYGDAALNRQGGVIAQTRFNRFLSFDETRGILHCEAGTSLADIITVLLPRGWRLPVTPGTKFVTVGGAIAADVHGKNHHVDGSFGNFVLDFCLLAADGALIRCSPSERADIYWATIGGMGLTGIIVSARLQLLRTESAYYDVTYRRTRNVEETLELLQATDQQYRYSVAWIDGQATGPRLGRSVLMLANEAAPAELPRLLRSAPLAVTDKRCQTLPMGLPGWLLNPWSVQAFNALYYASHGDRRRIVDYDSYFFPLDRLRHWNRIYGRRGFIQYQALFPPETSRRGVIELLRRVAASRRASFLAVLKTSGPASQGLLSYLFPGHTLALDFPNTGEDLHHLLSELDQVLLNYGGRLYLAKDAAATAKVFFAMYPRLPEFLAIKARLDPNCRFASSQARRLGIVPAEIATVKTNRRAA